jgi:uncharacterized protein YjdB
MNYSKSSSARVSIRPAFPTFAWVLAIIASSCALISCGGGSNPPAPKPTPTLQSVSVSPQNGNVAAGLTEQYSATGSHSDGSSKALTGLDWTTSSSDVAKVDATGLVTTLKQGTVTISGTSSGTTGSPQLTVGPPSLLSIGVSPQTPTISTGQTLQFAATGTYTDGSTQNLNNVTWSSLTPAAATVI